MGKMYFLHISKKKTNLDEKKIKTNKEEREERISNNKEMLSTQMATEIY